MTHPAAPTSLSTAAAHALATTTKAAPQAKGTTPRWLPRVLPWTDVEAGTYRLTRTTRRALPRHGSAQPAVVTSAGHTGEADLPGMYVDYARPRAYPMAVAQSVLRVHTRVSDLYNQPMNQFEEQLRLTLEVLLERQEDELVNSPEFGLLRSAVDRHRIRTLAGPPTPTDLDRLVSKQTRPRYLLAHPRAIAAFGRQCNRAGVAPETTTLEGRALQSWRGIPILPCDKLRVARDGTTTILVLRPGTDRQGVTGLRPARLPGQLRPGVSLHRMGTDDRAVTDHLVSVYHSLSVPIPNAVCALDGVEVGHR